jgi:hypothetical protein
MMEKMEKNPRQQPIQCWGCGRNNMHKDFPQIGDKERTADNVQQVATIEDMGINVCRIYTKLNNKKDEFHLNMIEVEGTINDQPVAILIDS